MYLNQPFIEQIVRVTFNDSHPAFPTHLLQRLQRRGRVFAVRYFYRVPPQCFLSDYALFYDPADPLRIIGGGFCASRYLFWSQTPSLPLSPTSWGCGGGELCDCGQSQIPFYCWEGSIMGAGLLLRLLYLYSWIDLAGAHCRQALPRIWFDFWRQPWNRRRYSIKCSEVLFTQINSN